MIATKTRIREYELNLAPTVHQFLMRHACYLSHTDAHENRANTVSVVIKAPEGAHRGRGAKGALVGAQNMTGTEIAPEF
jgi:hypothetical protein